MNNEYNKELILVHQFLEEKHQEFRNSNRIKSNDERRKYAHAVKTVSDIAYNCIITDKPNPNTNKKQQLKRIKQLEQKEEEHTELYNIATKE